MQRKHSSEAMTGAPGALPGEAIRVLILIVALYAFARAPFPTTRTIMVLGWEIRDTMTLISDQLCRPAADFRHLMRRRR